MIDSEGGSRRFSAFLINVLTNTKLRYLLLAICLLAIVWFACLFELKLRNHGDLALTDFNDFVIVGRMVLEGQAAGTYDWNTLQAEQLRQTGTWAFMPWAYPPQFTLFLAPLAYLPISLAYLLLVGGSFLLFYTALCRLSGKWATGALIFAMPAILINAKCGQNGFLIAGLIGWFLVYFRENDDRAGLPLGAMLVKPHLAVAIGIIALLDKRWNSVKYATAVVVITSVFTAAVLGFGIWFAFLGGTAESGAALWAGRFPLERMTSVFAALHRFGVPPATAMVAHVLVATSALVVLLFAYLRNMKEHHLLALVVLVTALISPYNYDYDMVIMALAAGLLLPDFVRTSRPWEIGAAFLLAWITLSNYLWIGLRQIYYGVKSIEWTMGLWTISPISLALLVTLSIGVVSRQARTGLCSASPL